MFLFHLHPLLSTQVLLSRMLSTCSRDCADHLCHSGKEYYFQKIGNKKSPHFTGLSHIFLRLIHYLDNYLVNLILKIDRTKPKPLI